MPDLRFQSQPPRHTEVPRPRRAEGQWSFGYSEPLNKNEQSKKDDDPLNVENRIRFIYSKRGFDSIDPADLRGRFRWMGLYTQRKPGIDGGKTGSMEEEELDDRYFMMRVRSDGKLLGADALRTLGGISTDFARGTADITDRQNIQYHWIDIVDVPEIWERLAAVGLDTLEACGDCPRGFLGSPVAGVAKDEILDGTPALEEIRRRYIGNPDYSNLPRKFKTSLSGHPSLDAAPEINDVSFVGVIHPEYGPGFDLWVGGGLSTNPMLATRLGVWIPVDEVPDAWEGVVSIFRDYGYRRLRSRARLKFLVADWGADKFREVLENEYLGRKLVRTESPAYATHNGDHIGIHEQKDGNFYIGITPTVGRINGAALTALGDIVEKYGVAGARLTAYQKVVVLGVAPEQVDDIVADLDAIGFSAKPSHWRRSTMACTGIEFCKLAIVDTKQRAIDLVGELEKRFPDLDTPISINVNGCPNACARTQIADIGLKGQLVLDDDGNQVEGFQVHLGGGIGLHTTIGKKLRAHKVTSKGLDDYVTTVVSNYLVDREGPQESFAQWVARTDEDLLRGDKSLATV
ncbi:nitrite/sulfite reductase [Nocardioides sp. L-11A]|uniref:nitrite/sulfite reductase n=1 Tax=Nocardioides sp. L-11A TaxID=3043848 RepID=UPI00249A9F17|nr:nitrite/sulfite reductase [Nocardioides sp. L-11A]